MSLGYFMRLDAREGYLEKIRALPFSEDYSFLFGMSHRGGTGENPHYHLVIGTKVNAQAFRVRMKKIFDQGKGNGHMSIKPWDGDMDACAYLFHEKDAEIVLRKGVSPEQLDSFARRNAEVQVEVAAQKEKAAWRIEDEVVKRMAGKRNPSDSDVAYQIVQAAFDLNKYVPNKYLLRAMIYNVQYKLCGGDEWDQAQLIAQIVRNLLYE